MLADWRVLPGILISFSLILIVFAIVGPLLIENEINAKLASQFLFTEASGTGYNRWVTNEQADSAPSYVYVYLYNITNPVEASWGEKPIVDEVGPYVYRQYLRNTNIAFDTYLEERVVTSTPYTYLVFDTGNLDNGNRAESDMITGANVGLWAVIHSAQVKSNPALIPDVLRACQLLGSTAFSTNNISSWLFGYTDPLLEFIDGIFPGTLPTTVVQYIRNQTSPQDAYNQVQTSTVSCGFPNTKRFQQMVRWRNNLTVTYFEEEQPVYGSPGNYFGFFRRGYGEAENTFWPLVARTLPLEVDIQTTYRDVSVYRYIFPASVTQNCSTNPTNCPFYSDGPNGLFNATSVLNGNPIFYSWPHFYQGDDSLKNYVEGLKNESLDDQSYIEIQPIIGANCHSERKVQGNLLFGGLVDYDNTTNVTYTNISIPNEGFIPMYWMNITSAITEAQASDMRTNLAFYDTAKVGSKAILFSCSLISPVLFGIAVVILWRRRNFWRRDGEGQLLGFGDETDTGEDIHIGYNNNAMKNVA